MSKISVVIAISSTEEELASECVDSVKDFADEIVVFSLGSNFSSKNKKLRLIKHQPVEYIELIREQMISSALNNWILILDPDERITSKLAAKLKEVATQDSYEIVNIPRKNIFFGKWIAHTNWWPDKQYRFFKKDSIKWPVKIHTYPILKGKVLDLKSDPQLAIEHYGYDNLSQFISRQIRYSKIEAKNLKENGVKFSYLNLFFYPARNFFVRFIYHRGYLDGIYGFILSFLTSFFIFAIWVQLKYDTK